MTNDFQVHHVTANVPLYTSGVNHIFSCFSDQAGTRKDLLLRKDKYIQTLYWNKDTEVVFHKYVSGIKF